MANAILDMPFDEADGSATAYDYGPGGHHAAVEAGRFIPGRFANCVYFPSQGKAEVIKPVSDVVDFALDFSFSIWAKSETLAEGPGRSWVLFKFPGTRNFISIELFTTFTYWQNVTIVQHGLIVKVYLDGELKGLFSRPSVMTGFAVLNDAPHATGGYCSLDGGKAYQSAITAEEVKENIKQTLQPVEFHVNNINFKSLGIVVERLDGVLDMPARKDPLKVDWEDYHGEVVDLMKPVLDVRNIELRCWIKAASKDELVSKWRAVCDIFESPGTQRLQIDAGTKPLLFDVYHADRLEPTNKWRNIGPYFIRFTLRLREPQPVKRVLRVSGSACSISLTSQKLLSISWGDGVTTHNVYGSGVSVSHTYATAGTYYVVISGNIEQITGFSTDAVVVWGRI